MTTPSEQREASAKKQDQRLRATRSLWRCCALRDGAGVERALAKNADFRSALTGEELDRIAHGLRRRVRARDLDGILPIALCARVGCLRGFEALFSHGALIHRPGRQGSLRMAIASRCLPMARKAVELARLKEINLDHGALVEAVDWGQREIIEALIALGADPSETLDGATPVIRAAERCMPWALQRLAEAGASLESRRASDGATALMISADKGSEPMMALAARLGANVNAVDAAWRPAIQRLALKRDPSALRWLLAHGADPEPLCPIAKLTALGRAIRSGNAAGANALLAGGANPHWIGPPDRSWTYGPSNPACASLNVFGALTARGGREVGDCAPMDRMGVLSAAIQSGADINAIDAQWNWPLSRELFGEGSAKRGALMLLAAGASTEILDAKGDTLLETSVLYHLGPRNRVEARHVEVLLERGARVTPRLRQIIEDTSWQARYSYDLQWFDLLRAAALRQAEAEELALITAAGARAGPKRM